MLSTGQIHSQPSASPWGQEDTKGSAMPLTGGGILGEERGERRSPGIQQSQYYDSSLKTYFLRPCICLTHGATTGNASLERQEVVGPRSSLLIFQRSL